MCLVAPASIKIHFLYLIYVILVIFVLLHQIIEIASHLSRSLAFAPLFDVSSCLNSHSIELSSISRTCFPIFAPANICGSWWVGLLDNWENHVALSVMMLSFAAIVLISLHIDACLFFFFLLLHFVFDDVLEAYHFGRLANIVVEEPPSKHVLLVHNVFLLVTKIRHHSHTHDLLV